MKLQIQSQQLRVRVDEAELAALLTGKQLQLDVRWNNVMQFTLDVNLGDQLRLDATNGWHLLLPKTEVEAYVATLPRRDALAFSLPQSGEEPLGLAFEVDVRDSLQVRGAKRRT